WVFFGFETGEGGIQFERRWDWAENVAFLGPDGITLHLGVDGIAAPMVLLTGIVIFAGALVSWKVTHRTKDFYILLMTLTAGVFGTFVALDLFFFFFYELAVIPMYLLIVVWGSTNKEYGAMKLTVMLVAASVLIFIAIFAIFSEAGIGTFDLPSLWAVSYDENFQKIVFPLIAIGCGVLGGLWPFHTWSPDGHVAAPTAVSMLHAGVLMKLGAFGVIRLGIQMLPEGAAFWMPGLLVLGTVNALYGAFSAMAQRDLKFMIGYSSVSHMGYVFMGLATLNVVGVNGAVLQMFAHGVMTALFFAMVGVIYDQAHTRVIPGFGGLAQVMPIFVIFFTIAGLSSLGLPGLAGFVAEFNIFVGLFQSYPVFGALGILAAAVTAAYILRMVGTAFFGQLNPRWRSLKDLQKTELVAGGLLVAAILWMGVYPKPFTDRIRDGIALLPGVEQQVNTTAEEQSRAIETSQPPPPTPPPLRDGGEPHSDIMQSLPIASVRLPPVWVGRTGALGSPPSRSGGGAGGGGR
ncbi:MAG: complex I subunit 4 family protein, partial [Dehalococcoidia bacterium]